MKICIDARSPRYSGVLTYTLKLIEQLLQIDRDNDCLVNSDHARGGWHRQHIEEIFVPSNSPLSWFLWGNVQLPRLQRAHHVDVYHSLKHVTAFRLPTRPMRTFHGAEMIYRFPESYRCFDLMYWRLVYPIAARHYDRILTGTQTKMRQFSQRKHIDSSKFRVPRFAPGPKFQRVEAPSRLREAPTQGRRASRLLSSIVRRVR